MSRRIKNDLWCDVCSGEHPLLLVWFSQPARAHHYDSGYGGIPAEEQVEYGVFKFVRGGLLGRMGML